MCEAEFAQIALEIEDFASLPRALGGLGVGILNAADDLAGGGAAVAQGARQASRELKLVVIGENMDRVRAYARMRGAMTINDWIPSPQWTFEKNMQWVRQIIAEGREVIDIGPTFCGEPQQVVRLVSTKWGVVF